MDTLEAIKELRNRTNIGLNECRSALDEAGGDIDRAIEVLQKRGALKAAARASRIATEGRVHTYVHNGGKLAVLIEVNCETDFAAKSEAFQQFCEQVALQVAGLGARWISRESVPEEEMTRQRHIFLHQIPGMTAEKMMQALQAGSDSAEFVKMIKILDGKTNKWFTEVCLMDQESITVSGKTLEQVRTALVAAIGENVTVRRFVRWEVGEGLEKKTSTNYADEVHSMIGPV